MAAENRILRGQIKGRLLLSEGEKATLAEIAHRLGREALKDVAATANPDTILGWYGKLIANEFDGSKFRRRAGRARINEEIERLVVQMAKENPSWGYDRSLDNIVLYCRAGVSAAADPAPRGRCRPVRIDQRRRDSGHFFNI